MSDDYCSIPTQVDARAASRDSGCWRWRYDARVPRVAGRVQPGARGRIQARDAPGFGRLSNQWVSKRFGAGYGLDGPFNPHALIVLSPISGPLGRVLFCPQFPARSARCPGRPARSQFDITPVALLAARLGSLADGRETWGGGSWPAVKNCGCPLPSEKAKFDPHGPQPIE